MTTITRTLGLAALVLAGAGLHAEDFAPLMNVARSTWPEKTHIGIICDYRASAMDVEALAVAAGWKDTITVVDTHNRAELERAQNVLVQHRPDYLILLSSDPVLPDGSFEASVMLGRLACKGIPTIATTPMAIKQGAVFTLGDATHGELLVNSKLIGTIDVILPDRGTFLRNASFGNDTMGGKALVQMASAR